jgi:uncharacterized membrane protein YdjX (TVP38/TMEM64 family)
VSRKWVLLLGGVILVGVVHTLFPIQVLLGNFNTWVRGAGSTGIIAFGLFYVLGTVFFLPGSVLTLAAGLLFGVVWGTLVVSVSATLGAWGIISCC